MDRQQSKKRRWSKNIKLQWLGTILIVVAMLIDYNLYVLPESLLLAVALLSMAMIGSGIYLEKKDRVESMDEGRGK